MRTPMACGMGRVRFKKEGGVRKTKRLPGSRCRVSMRWKRRGVTVERGRGSGAGEVVVCGAACAVPEPGAASESGLRVEEDDEPMRWRWRRRAPPKLAGRMRRTIRAAFWRAGRLRDGLLEESAPSAVPG